VEKEPPKDTGPSRVRIRQVPEMQTLGIAGLVGLCFGESVPSSSGVSVSGPCPGDYAICVWVDEHDEGYWVAPQFVELVGED
jgi:hypothetical protein